MRYLRLMVLALFTIATLVAFTASASKEDSKKTGKACTYCHEKGNPKAPLTEAGKYYKEHNKSLDGYKEPEKKGKKSA